MNVEVQRNLYSSLSVQGQMFLDGTFECYTLEPPDKDPTVKPRAILCGTYPLTVRWSDKFQRHVPHVENVPGFVAIEQHVGNYPRDTDGCTLVGQQRGPSPNFIGRSLLAFTALMAKYMAVGVLRNPNDTEKEHIWDIGQVTYSDARTVAPDVGGEISV